jgi:hypothetical protein
LQLGYEDRNESRITTLPLLCNDSWVVIAHTHRANMGENGVGGVLLLIGVYKRLALVLLIPIIVNIVGVHLFLDPSGLPIGILTTALAVYLVSVEWKGFSQLLVK